MKRPTELALRYFAVPLCLLAPAGRGPSGEPQADTVPASRTPAIRAGSRLYDSNGELWGTVLEVRAAHTFPNGVTEPGVLVDYGPRMGNPPVPPRWLPARSAARFTVR